jgi:hypothetical protein
MRSVPNAKDAQVGVFKDYIERQIAANHSFVDKLLYAKDFKEALRIQVEYLQSQLKVATETSAKFGTEMASPFKRLAG